MVLPPELAVIVPCGAAHAAVLADCLASLHEQHDAPRFELLVVHSHGERRVAETAARFVARLVTPERSSTAGAARNLGVRACAAPLVGFIDADCTAERDWLRAGHDALAGGLVAVGGPVLNAFPLHPVATMDNLMQFVDQAPGRPAGRAGALPGCNLAMTRAAFLALGGFDACVRVGEDTLLTNCAAQRWPERVRFVPAMRVRHRGRTSVSALIAHQHEFGLHRGRYALHLTPARQRRGRSRTFAALAAGRRLGYFAWRTACWDRGSLLRLVAFAPILAIALVAWARGFNRGCRSAAAKLPV